MYGKFDGDTIWLYGFVDKIEWYTNESKSQFTADTVREKT